MTQAVTFISHSSSDKQTAIQLAHGLRQRDIEVWIDHEQIRFGDSVPGKIAEGLKQCDAILVLISTSFMASSWCRSEYEPLLTREINEGRTVVIPLRLDDGEVPVLLAAKRYADVRAGITETILDELADAIASGRSVTTLRRLTPKRARTYECSLLAIIISSIIHDYPVAQITDSDILTGRSLIDLYRTIEALIGRYEEVCQEILALLEESGIRERFYGSGNRVSPSRIAAVNRRLVGIAKDMREISSSLDGLLRTSSELRERFSRLLEVCVSISIAEDFLIVQLGAPANIPPAPDPADAEHAPRWGERKETPILDNILAPNYLGDLGGKMIEDFARVLEEIHGYRGELRNAVARLTTIGP